MQDITAVTVKYKQIGGVSDIPAGKVFYLLFLKNNDVLLSYHYLGLPPHIVKDFLNELHKQNPTIIFMGSLQKYILKS